jgi:murein DD-endopeptidase MepM/ murein hydrolase activator NlpD
MAGSISPKSMYGRGKNTVKKLIIAKIAGILLPVIGFFLLFVLIITVIIAGAYNANKWAINTYVAVSQAYTDTVEFFFGKEPSPEVPTAVMGILKPLEEQYKIPWVFIYTITKDRNINDYSGIAIELTADGFKTDWKVALDKYGVDNKLGDNYSSKLLNSMSAYLKTPPLIYPLSFDKGIVTEEEGTDRTNADGSHTIHKGIDVADVIDTPIYAAHAGIVTESVSGSSTAGNFVVIQTKDRTIYTRYLHMDHPSELKVGQEVSPGDYIGPMGKTGDVTGVHLHFEVYMNGQLQNPRDFIYFPRTTSSADIPLNRGTVAASDMR